MAAMVVGKVAMWVGRRGRETCFPLDTDLSSLNFFFLLFAFCPEGSLISSTWDERYIGGAEAFGGHICPPCLFSSPGLNRWRKTAAS